MYRAVFTGRLAAIAAILASLAGCLEDSDGSITLSGNVGAGTLAGASISVHASGGEALGTSGGGLSATYSIGIETLSTDYPLKVSATGGVELSTGLEPAIRLESAVVDESEAAVANLNAYSSLVVAVAEQMDGSLSGQNIDAATSAVITELNGGLTTLAETSPISAPIDDSNRAELFRGSTMLTEILKRVDDTMAGVDGVSDIDAVIASVASDLSDGLLDTNGGEETHASTSAVTMIVYAKLALEALANDLHVNGTSLHDSTDATVRSLVERMGALPIGEYLLATVKGGVDAALALEPSAELEALQITLDAIDPDMSPEETAQSIDSAAAQALDATIRRVSYGSADDVDRVNRSYRRWMSGRPSEPEPTTEQNAAPILSGEPDRIATVGIPYSFTPEADDPDGDPLVFDADGVPAWTVFDTATGSLSGMPSAGDVGTQSGITISASDGLATTTIGPFRITVEQPTPEPTPNSAPEIGGTPPAVVSEGSSYRFTPEAFDADGDVLRFTIDRRPSWLVFDAETGTITGIPGAADAGMHDNIVIGVTDGIDSDSLAPFSIFVEALTPEPEAEPDPEPDPIPEPDANVAPSITGDPPTSLQQGDDYYFSPRASDPDGDVLTFGIVNKPLWAIFDPRTGVLSGQPTTSADVGVHADIVINVSDGAATAELPPFSITVIAVHQGTATLSWLPPTENSDGSPLLDLAGYHVLWGTDPDDLAFSATIENPGITSYVVEGLSTGTYHFAVTAFNDNGLESDWSNIATKTIH